MDLMFFSLLVEQDMDSSPLPGEAVQRVVDSSLSSVLLSVSESCSVSTTVKKCHSVSHY